MRTITYAQAIREALVERMGQDESIVLMGEDATSAWGPTQGIEQEFPGRVLDMPITESAFVGAAVGAAATGLRPVVDLLFVDFATVCFDQIVNQAAKLRYMTGGGVRVPLVLRAMWGTGMRRGAQHSQALHPLFVHVPGLKVVTPSNPADAKGLMATALQEDDPVLFLEHKMLYFTPGEVPEEPYAVPFGEASVVREGSSCTVVAVGRMVQVALEAADRLAESGVRCEVLDPRTLSPFDNAAVYRSVEKTGHLVVVDEAHPRCGLAADVAAQVAQDCHGALRGPVRMVTAPHAPVPFSPALEDAFTPDAAEVVEAVRATGAGEPAPALA
ncbi:alpha-ketoacid dehydrogenase subunit beta [Streptomyces xiaopingdaonensis]|uniref:alpha-ketoacid dehydrogenase subunit beta n=1 Tax=Streptomyces xiaopingdaonensis TaxID=1565415 RepID=UPI0003134C9F|nr:pyruvate dehydrogenase complex E1 component subunit beta [Streptomyces xiaopingdaonensis]